MSTQFNNTTTSNHFVFVDGNVPDLQTLLDGIIPGTTITVLDESEDGVEQVTRCLSEYPDNSIASLHIISHGGMGRIQLGSSTISSASLSRYSQHFHRWSAVLANRAEILLYGCHIAAEELGKQFVNGLSQLTQATIAASTTLTGSTALGGDWNLDYQTGAIAAELVISPQAQLAYSSVLPDIYPNPFYSVQGNPSELYLVDITDGSQTQIPNGQLAFRSFAISRDINTGRIYYVGATNNAQVGYWDPTTQTNTTLPNTTGVNVVFLKLAQAQDSTIYGLAANSPDLYAIDPSTGVATNLGAISGGTPAFTDGSGDAAFDPNNPNILYVSVLTSGELRLYQVDITTQVATYVGESGIPNIDNSGSLGFGLDGNLYAVVRANGNNNERSFVQLSLTDGTATTILQPSENSGDFGTLVTSNPDVDFTISKSDGLDDVVSGSNITYTITLTNNEIGDRVPGLIVRDSIPTDVSITSWNAAITNTSGQSNIISGASGTSNEIFTTVNIGPDDTLTILAEGTVTAAAGTTITNTVQVPGINDISSGDTLTDTTNVIDAATPTPAPQVVWAKVLNGSNHNYGWGINTDSDGSVYVSGNFIGSIDLDEDGTADLTSAAYQDAYIAKYSSNGTLAWANQVAGGFDVYGYGISTDSDGNVYATGSFYLDIDLNGDSTADLTSTGNQDAYIAKYSSDGTLAWATQVGGSSADQGYGIRTDSQGNVYATGYFSGSIDLDGDGAVDLTSAGVEDAYIAKYSSDGTLTWAVEVGGSSAENSLSISLDDANNVYVTGQFNGNLDIDGDGAVDLTSAGVEDAYIAKYSSDGTLAWATQVGGSSSDRGHGISTDSMGNVYATGIFNESIDLDGDGSTDLSSAGVEDAYIAKYSSGDGSLVWATRVGGNSLDQGYSIDTDSEGNVYATGIFNESIDLDGDGTIDLSSAGSHDAYIAKYSSDGTLAWATQVGDSTFDFGYGISTDSQGNVYATGGFEGDLDLDGDGIPDLTSAGGRDTYIIKLTSDLNQMNGSSGADRVWGTNENDRIEGLDGNDKLSGNDGDDIITGDGGNDRLNGNKGNDVLSGGIGNDRLFGGRGNDLLDGDEGNDSLMGDRGDDRINGGIGNDTLFGSQGRDWLNGDEGDDSLMGGNHEDTINGGIGNDTGFGGGKGDWLNGDEGDDSLMGDRGDDTVSGGVGNDTLFGGKDDDFLAGGAGNDVLSGDFGRDTLLGGTGNDLFVLPLETAVNQLSQADLIQDYQVGGDRIGLTGGLNVADLTLNAQGNNTVIGIADTNQVLGILAGQFTLEQITFVSVSL
ncbi:DUF4347 domain-containing protein [Roseofilum casamattae]|uniref:DUF4347 domain-containing protein n=1 Tax=Roseofilum casamattae BLCC-M143 TaxID=3022442 RepID=A0ABT7BXJ3_9CYAN|nr:DUF4347 domain-containing protein [Roseofilum casamattae]MDJ1183547.1 DUF4347 domain-containing protein [Roseofilum casamattae BLCC-M143]